MSSIPSKMGAEYYRTFLSEQGKNCYDSILKQLEKEEYSGVTSINIIDGTSAASDCFDAYKAIRDDHPEFFFLGSQSEFVRLGNKGELKYPILYTEDHIRRIRRQLRRCIYTIVKGTADMSTIDREIVVYERIARKLAYTNHQDVRDHNIVGPVLFSSGVCEGHNALLLLCLRRIGIPCIKVYGKVNEGGWHCWTIAWIGGVPVHCDVTWDKPDKYTGVVWFNYFNLPDQEISSNHRQFSGAQIPTCRSYAYTYYCYKGLSINSEEELISHMKKTAHSRKPTMFHLTYKPTKGDLADEVRAAFRKAKINESISIQTYTDLNNVVITHN